jgi:hypothetical protein
MSVLKRKNGPLTNLFCSILLVNFFLSVLRIGKAKRYLGSYVDAKKYLEKALRRDPENVEVGEELVTNFTCLQFPNKR